LNVPTKIRLLQSAEGWSVSCLDLPGCHSQGDTREEALVHIREAIDLWLEVEAEEAGLMHVEPWNWPLDDRASRYCHFAFGLRRELSKQIFTI
jgi:predicted RNase H-like HicB family nuclease